MLHHQLKFVLTSFAIFFCIIYLEVCLVSIATQSLPNQLVFSGFDKVDLFINLLQINPSAAVNLIFLNTPVFVIQRLTENQSNQVWGIYFLPVTLLIHLVLSVYIARFKKFKTTPQLWLWVSSSSTILIICVFYLRVQSCCTSEPNWLPEVLLLSRIYSPFSDSFYWQNIYSALSPWLITAQFILFAASIAILFKCYKLAQRTNSVSL